MNEQEKNERRKIIAMALDIAVKLTNAKDAWLKEDDNGNIVMHDPLYSTARLVMKVLNDDSFMAVSDVPKVFRGTIIESPDKSKM